jgi:hypothetical protein
MLVWPPLETSFGSHRPLGIDLQLMLLKPFNRSFACVHGNLLLREVSFQQQV